MPSITDTRIIDSCLIARAIKKLEKNHDLKISDTLEYPENRLTNENRLTYDEYANLRNNLASIFYDIYKEYENTPSYIIRGAEFLRRLRDLMFKYNKMLIRDYDRDFYPKCL